MIRYIRTPIGVLALEGAPDLRAVRFDSTRERDLPDDPDDPVATQLAEYFAGERREFTVSLTPQGTEFQRRVWEEVARIPYGETRSYLDIATTLGDRNLVRAVGAANGANPLPIIVPCHRVVGADGRLTGYAGGVERKAWLLEHESSQQQLPLG